MAALLHLEQRTKLLFGRDFVAGDMKFCRRGIAAPPSPQWLMTIGPFARSLRTSFTSTSI